MQRCAAIDDLVQQLVHSHEVGAQRVLRQLTQIELQQVTNAVQDFDPETEGSNFNSTEQTPYCGMATWGMGACSCL